MAADLVNHRAAQMPRIWRFKRHISVPTVDILSFAFENLGSYDLDRPIFVDAENPSDCITAGYAHQTVRRLVKGLQEHGLQEGDCVCLRAYNNIWYPLLWLSVIGAGGVISGINPAYTSTELVDQFRATRAKFVIVQEDCLTAVEEATTICDIPRSNVFILPKIGVTHSDKYQSWQVLLNHGEANWASGVGGDTIAVYANTSGTTGLPKAAAIPHSYVVSQGAMLEDRLKCSSYAPSQLICLPVFHAFAAGISLILPLRLGVTTYFLPRFNLEDFIRAVNTFQITDTVVVPPIVTAISNLSITRRPALASLRYIICAGAPITAALQDKLYNCLSPDAVIAQCWGTTELGWLTLFNRQQKDSSGSVGYLIPNVELKIIDSDNNMVTTEGVTGEALIKSSSVFRGYQNNSQASRDAFDSFGFYKTGDRVFVRDDKVFIDGRIKDIMKVNGWQVSPAEIEGVLLQHPQIADAAVSGVTSVDKYGLEQTLPRAHVVCNHEATSVELAPSPRHTPSRSSSPTASDYLTEQDVKAYIASRMVRYKRLSGGVMFVDCIPRNSTGKILRHLLPDIEPEASVYHSESSFSAESTVHSQDSLA